MPRIPIIAAALSAALALVAPCGAAPAGAAPAPDREGCAPMMADWQGREAAVSAMGEADLRAYNDVQNEVDHAAHLCEAGRDAESRAVMLRSGDPARRGP